MKTLNTLLAGTALVFATGAVAQDMAAEADTMPPATTEAMPEEAPAAETPMAEAEADAATETEFTDAQIESFAAAALELQKLEGGPAANQEAAAAIVADSGIDTDTFNAISQAMQSDPEVAERVQLAAAELQGAQS